MNAKVRTFIVLPYLPRPLARLRELAYNLWWTWNEHARDCFLRLDREIWSTCYHNPVVMLNQLPQTRLDAAAKDVGLVAQVNRVLEDFDRYMNGESWFHENYGDMGGQKIAYFSAEFGLSECLPVYSGGLGVLAGDHLKSASDLGLPLVAVGLLYRQGYFRQTLTPDGWQQETYPDNDFYQLPLSQVLDETGKPLHVGITVSKRKVAVQVWKCQVGRVPLYLLDTDLPENHAEDREITHRLYGGDQGMRIRQELLLGVGGMRALKAMGITPGVVHMNEGHAAFSALERIAQLVKQDNITPADALEAVRASNLFTTHTPVAAGNDVFFPGMAEEMLDEYIQIWGHKPLLGFGRVNPEDEREGFGLTVLALKTAGSANGVSELHGHVSRKMWQELYRNYPEDEIPIGHVTNGIHGGSWVSPDMASLFDRYLGPRWLEAVGDQNIWDLLEGIPDTELWRTHERNRERLVSWARRSRAESLRRRGAPPSEIKRAEEVLDPEAITIGFARRFATYKRATLILRDMDRLRAILGNKSTPVQIIMAGKAHPRDHQGKEYIQAIVKASQDPALKGRIVFVEDYDMNVSRYLVQGVDVWLNTPRRPYEASGTSGMKVCANGGINMSVLDGWWCEGYQGDNGWAIGDGRIYDDPNYQDELEAQSLYALLEQEVVPMFYDRTADGLPRRWVQLMKRSMGTCIPLFNTHRMVQDYTERYYLPLFQCWETLRAKSFAKAKELAIWKAKIQKHWSGVRVVTVQAEGEPPYQVGSKIKIKAQLTLGEITPDDVRVEVYVGEVDVAGQFKESSRGIPMNNVHKLDSGAWEYSGVIDCHTSGRQGYAVRVMPYHPDQAHASRLMQIKWS